MSKEESSEFFWNIFNCCYPVKSDEFPNCILWIYDEKFNRKLKLCIINNQGISIPKNMNTGSLLFVQNINKKNLYINNNEIWNFFDNNLRIEDKNVKLMIYEILDNRNNDDIFILNSYDIIQHLPYDLITYLSLQKEREKHFHVWTSYFFLHFQHLHNLNIYE